MIRVGLSRLLRGIQCPSKRGLVTLAIETSCDDTSVAILERCESTLQHSLHFNRKITADNSANRGIHPAVAVTSHQENLALLIRQSLQHLPILDRGLDASAGQGITTGSSNGELELRMRPDFVAVTRGPGITAALASGLDTAKGLAVAWQVPLVGVNHMQAHALTPRLVSALSSAPRAEVTPRFPYLSLLVSGGHTMLVHSNSLCQHTGLTSTCDIALGDALDKMARSILPPEQLCGKEIMYGRLLEKFAFPDGQVDYGFSQPRKGGQTLRDLERGWALPVPLSTGSRDMRISFSGLETSVRKLCALSSGKIPDVERVDLARECMRIAFEHVTKRVVWALGDLEKQKQSVSTLVISGGVASNGYLRYVLRSMLSASGFRHVELVSPPVELCTDNAAMIAWTGLEMYDQGWSTGLGCRPLRKWSIDPMAPDGGVLGAEHWVRM